MVDMSELYADSPLRAGFVKKLQKAQEKLDKIMVKAAPVEAEIAMYNEMIAAIDKRLSAFPPAPEQETETETEAEEEPAGEATGQEAVLSVTEHADGSATLAVEEKAPVPAFLCNMAAEGEAA